MSIIRKSVSLLGLLLSLGFVCTSFTGCDPAHETVWSTQSRSPNGYWLATGNTVRYSGPGNAAVITSVYLQRTDKSTPAVEVLEFFHDGPGSQSGIALNIQWPDVLTWQLRTTDMPALISRQSKRQAWIYRCVIRQSRISHIDLMVNTGRDQRLRRGAGRLHRPNGSPTAVLHASTLYYLQDDCLGTPLASRSTLRFECGTSRNTLT